MVKHRKKSLADPKSKRIVKNLLDTIDQFEECGGATVDREAFLEALVDGINVCKQHSFLQNSFINWLVYDSIISLEDFDKNDNESLSSIQFHILLEAYEALVNSCRRAFCYWSTLLESEKDYISLDTVSSDCVLKLILEEPVMNLKNKIDRDVRELFEEAVPRESINVSLREHINILNSLDERVDGLLDFDSLIKTLIENLDQRFVNKKQIVNAVDIIDLDTHMLIDDFVIVNKNDDEFSKLNIELLTELAVKLMETLIVARIYQDGRMKYKPLPMDIKTGSCRFLKHD